MNKVIVAVLASLWLNISYLLIPSQVQAADSRVLGIHVLQTEEVAAASKLLASSDDWHYVTIPLTLQDLENPAKWQTFFNSCKEQKLIPIVRLATKFENNSWQVPNKKELVDLIGFLSKLTWPTPDKHIIILNEVNHKAEFGGELAPAEYAKILEFASDWAHTEGKNFKVLPAALDLAASNTANTSEAFDYLNKILAANPDVINKLDYWNSHSYPNPGFSASPTKTGQNSLRGFEHELAFIKDKTGKDFRVFITETGWVENNYTANWLDEYYEYALQHIWSDGRVVAVTPFILKGAPGPFAGFSFLNEANQPTKQYLAFKNLLEKY